MIKKQVFQKNGSMVCRTIDNQTIMVPIRRNVGDLQHIYTLNKVAARIWELIDGQKTFEDIQENIVSKYCISSEKAEKDISKFIKQLIEVEAVKQI